MLCPKCGATLTEDSKFCEACGVQLDAVEEAVAPAENATKTEIVQEREFNEQPMKNLSNGVKFDKTQIIKLIVGTLIIIIGFIRIMTAGTSISTTSFGADFYTFTYRGIVAISELLASIQVSLGWILVAIGASIDVSALRQ